MRHLILISRMGKSAEKGSFRDDGEAPCNVCAEVKGKDWPLAG